MDIPDVFTKTNLITSILGFALTVMIVLCVHLKQPISFVEGFIAGVIIYIVTLLIVAGVRTWDIHSMILWRIRRYLQFILSSIVIEEWNATIDISTDGDAKMVHDFKGKVNFGANKWIEIEIIADGEQPCGRDFPVTVTNMDTSGLVDPDMLVDYPTFKKVRVHFDRPLYRGETFHYKMEYPLAKTFFFNKDDYYEQYVTHFEKQINIRLNFDNSIIIRKAWGEVMTQHGESWPIRKAKEDAQFGRHYIQWTISKAYLGHRHKISWTSTQKTEKTQS